MAANRSKSESFIAEYCPQRIPQLTGQLTATVDCAVDWWWHALGLDLIDWPLTAIADWLWADYQCSLSCICPLGLDQFLSVLRSWTILNVYSSNESSWFLLFRLVHLRSWPSNFWSWSILNWFTKSFVLQISWLDHFLLCILWVLWYD